MSYLKFIIICLIFTPVTTFADTTIDMKSEDGMVQFMTNGNTARINMPDKSDYLILDYSNNSMIVVMPEKKQAMDMSGMSNPFAKNSKTSEKIDMIYKKTGSGPKIAGYATTKYSLSAKGQHCGTAYMSSKAISDTNLENMFNAMSEMAEKQRKSMGGFMTNMSVCEQAKNNVPSNMKTIGLPLKSLNEKGNLESEVVKINLNVNVPSASYQVPSGYEVISMANMMQNSMTDPSQRRNSKQQVPNMDEVMKQMQQSGELTPEMLQQMQKMQDMMKQNQ